MTFNVLVLDGCAMELATIDDITVIAWEIARFEVETASTELGTSTAE